MNVTFFDDGFPQYTYWQEQDKQTLRKIDGNIEIASCRGHYDDK